MIRVKSVHGGSSCSCGPVLLQDTGRGKKRKHLSGGSEGESPLYSGGDWRDDHGKVIAEAGMILRDPSALHLIIKQVIVLQPHHTLKLATCVCICAYMRAYVSVSVCAK